MFKRSCPSAVPGSARHRIEHVVVEGEIDVIECAASLTDRAKQAGVALIPAVGFDVVPSDCLAAMLAERLPGPELGRRL